MKILSNGHFMQNLYRLIFGLLLIVWSVPSASAGDTPHHYFKLNKQKILSKNHSEMNGFVFAVGRAVASDHDNALKERTMQKARLIAIGNLTKPISHISGWPFLENLQLQREVVQNYATLKAQKFHVKNLQAVYRDCQGISCTVVVAAPARAIDIKHLYWVDIRNSFDRAYEAGDERIPLSVYFEICAENRLDQVLNDISHRWGDRYGVNVQKVIQGHYIDTPAFLWRQGKRLPGNKVATLGFQDLMKLLELDPYDPVVLYFLGQNAESVGRNRLAQMFYSRALLWEIDPEYNKRCRQLINSNLFINKSEPLNGLEKELQKKAIAIYGNEGPFEAGLANLVFLSLGTLPLIGSSDTHVTSIYSDNVSVHDFINNNPTATAFATVSKIFMERGQWEYALPFAIQASQMDGGYAGLRKTVLNFATRE